MHLLRLLTALMLLFGLICGACCQNRGTTKFNRPQDSNAFGIDNENLENESDKSLRSNRVREIVNGPNVNAHRKSRFRSREELEINDKPREEQNLPRNHKFSPLDDVSPVTRKRPVRVGRRRLTTPMPSTDIPMVIPQKVNQNDITEKPTDIDIIDENHQTVLPIRDLDDVDTNSEKPANVLRDRNFTQTIPVANYRRSSFPITSTTILPTTIKTSLPTRASYRKSNRYQANASGKIEAVSSETTTQRISRRPIIKSTEKTQIDLEQSTTPLPPTLSRGTVRSKNLVKEKDELEDLEDENYPEHFKLLLKANYKSNLSTAAPEGNKVTKFKNFKSRRVVPYRGYKQNSAVSTTPSTASETSSKLNFPRLNRNDKRTKNVSIESNDVYVKDLDSTKENFNLVKETNYPERTTVSGRISSQLQLNEKTYEVTTFKPAISKLLARNKLFKSRGPSVDRDVNIPQLPANHAPASVSEIPPSSLHRYSSRYKSDNNFKSNSGSKSGTSNPYYVPTIPPRSTDADSITTQYIYNEVEPVHSGLMHSPIGVETPHHSSAMTVSIFGALSDTIKVLSQTTESISDILSQTTESLSYLTSTTSTSTVPPTTTTTTTTTPAPPTTKFTTPTTEQVQEISPDSSSVPQGIKIHVNNQNYPNANHIDEITISENEIPTRSARLIESGTMIDPNIPTASPIPQVLETKLTDITDALKNFTKIAQLTIPISTVPNYILTSNASSHLIPLMSLTDSSTSSTKFTITDTDKATTTTRESTGFPSSQRNDSYLLEDDSTNVKNKTTLNDTKTTLDAQILSTTPSPIASKTPTITPTTDLQSLRKPIPTSLTDLSTIQDFSNLRSRLVTSLADTNHQRPIYVMPRSNSEQQKTTISMSTSRPLEKTTPLSEPKVLSANSMSSLLIRSTPTTLIPTPTSIVTPIPILSSTIPPASTTTTTTTRASLPITLSSTMSTNTISTLTTLVTPITESQLKTTIRPSTMEVPKLSSTTEFPPDYMPRFSKRIPILPVRPPKRDYVVYGILPNNTVVKKIIDESTTENSLIIYGILPNNTVVRKYPNGTIVPEVRNNILEITDIDPKSLTDPNSDFYQHTHKETVPNDTNTMPLNEKEIFTTMAPSTSITASIFNATDLASTTITTTVNSTPAMTASSIIDLLKNYNQTDTQLKTQNIFSLAPTSPAQINNMREKYLTLDIDPVTNQVRDPNDLDNQDNLDGSVYQWKPVSSTTEASRGVEIIKSLVEQAKTTDEVPTVPGAVQSLTTSKNKQAGRGFAVVTTAQTSTSTEEMKPNVPFNIKENDLNMKTNDENKVLPTNLTPLVTLIDPPITDIDTTSISISSSTTTTIPSQTKSTTRTTVVSTTTPNPTKSSNTLRRTTTTTNHPITATNPSTPFQDQSTLQRNLLLLQELLGLTEDGTGSRRNQGNSLRPTTVLMRRPTTTSTTSTTTTPKPTTTTTMRTTTRASPIIPASVRSVQFNSIDDILNSLQTELPTTQKPRTTTSVQVVEVDDLTFINRLRSLLNPSLTTRKPPTRATTTRTTTTTTTTTTTPKPTNPTTFPSNINDLFASFPELTTKKPATFSDSDDIAFLAGLRQIAQLDQPKQSAVQDPDFANKIIQLAINRTGKSTSSNKLPSDEQPLTSNVLHPNSIKIETPEVKPALSKSEIERGKQDIETVNSDLKLLSTLLGRPISPNDLPQLTQQFGGATSSDGPRKRYPSSTTTTSTSSTTTQKPAIVKEVELLQSLLRSPNKDIKSQVGSDEYYGNTDEAILATILKQKGIGPSHNNIPIEQLLGQNNNYYQPTRTTTTTRRPRPPTRQSRPLLDGLSWLWRTWQDTAPGPQPAKLRATNPREVSNTPSSQQLYDDGTDSDTYTKPLDSSEEASSPLAPAGGGLLSAAIGVTRAVTQFLGAALQGAGRSIQSAWSSQPPSASSSDNNYFRLSG